MLKQTQQQYSVVIDDENQLWTSDAIRAIATGMQALVDHLQGGIDQFASIFEGTRFVREDQSTAVRDANGNIRFVGAHTEGSSIFFNNDQFADFGINTAPSSTVHELAHVMDNREGRVLSHLMMLETKGQQQRIEFLGIDLGPDINDGKYRPGGSPATPYGRRTYLEDWAEALMVTVFPTANVGMDNTRRDFVLNALRPRR